MKYVQNSDRAELKVAICKTSLMGPISGADETLVTYATELHRAGTDLTVVLLYPPPHTDPYYRRLIKAGVPLKIIAEHSITYKLLRFGRDLAAHVALVFTLLARYPGHVRKIWRAAVRLLARFHGRRSRQYFRESGFDVLHVLTGDVALIQAAHATGTPLLFHELGTPDHMPEIDGTYERLARVTPLCTRIAALSPTLAHQWHGKLPNARQLLVLPLLVTPPKDLSIPRRATPFTVIFGFAARLERGKGPAILLDAFSSLTEHFEEAYLRLAGAGPLSSSLRIMSREKGLADRVEFTTGYRTEVGRAAFLRTIDVFVLPTLAEGTPNCIIEAMAIGLPVIASAVGGIPDMITPATGILVPPGEPDALREAMRTLAGDPALRARMGQAAKKRYLERYDREAVIPELLRTYRQVAAEGRERVAPRMK